MAKAKLISPRRISRGKLIGLAIAAGIIGVVGLLASHASSPGSPWFSPNSFYNAALPDSTPLDSQSNMYVQHLVNQVNKYGSFLNIYQWSIPIWTVPANTPTTTVADNTGAPPTRVTDEWGQVPWTAAMKPSNDTDKNMAIWQPSTDTLWEFWDVTSLYPTPAAAWGGRMNNVSTSGGVYPKPYGASASGLSTLGGLITMDDIRKGSIDHAIALTVPENMCSVRAPATRYDCWDQGNAVQEGMRFRLPASFNVDKDMPNAAPIAKMIATAIQKYGMVVRDTSGAVSFVGEDPQTDPNNNPWPGVAWNYSTFSTQNFPWSQLQVMPPCTIQPDASCKFVSTGPPPIPPTVANGYPSGVQGNWVGTYGADGYDLAAWNGATGSGTATDLVNMPGVTVSLTKGSRWVWNAAAAATDIRSLESPDKSTREQATYYDPNQLQVQLSFSKAYTGNLHLYALDDDAQNRRETITVNDGSGAQTTAINADFSAGAWASFPIKVASGGSVSISVQNNASTTAANAVLSGIFLGDATPTTTKPTSTPDTTPPSVPTGLQATAASSSTVNLSWQPSTDNVGVTKYTVYRNGTVIATVTSGTSYSDTSVVASTQYTYAVSASDAAGNASAESAGVQVTTPAAPQTTGSPGCSLVGDINADGTVNALDLSILLSDWGTSNAKADLNHDGTVNALDLSILLSNWGKTC